MFLPRRELPNAFVSVSFWVEVTFPSEIYFQYLSNSKEDDEAMDSSFKQLFMKLAGVVSKVQVLWASMMMIINIAVNKRQRR